MTREIGLEGSIEGYNEMSVGGKNNVGIVKTYLVPQEGLDSSLVNFKRLPVNIPVTDTVYLNRFLTALREEEEIKFSGDFDYMRNGFISRILLRFTGGNPNEPDLRRPYSLNGSVVFGGSKYNIKYSSPFLVEYYIAYKMAPPVFSIQKTEQ